MCEKEKDFIYPISLAVSGLMCVCILFAIYAGAKIEKSKSTFTEVVTTETVQTRQTEYENAQFPMMMEPEYERAIIEISKNMVSETQAKVIVTTVENTCRKYNAPVDIILSMGAQESKFWQKESRLGAEYGRYILMVSEIGLKDYNRVNGTSLKPEDLMDLATNIEVGVWCYKQNFTYLKNLGYENLTYEDGVVAYNCGAGDYAKYRYSETYMHLTKVNYYLEKYF